MNEKRKCEKCKLLIDSDLETCPYCGYKQEKKEEKEVIEVTPTQETEVKKEKRNLFNYESCLIKMKFQSNLLLFCIGFLGLSVISTVLSIFVVSQNLYLTYFTEIGSAAINFASYLILLGVMLLVISSDLPSYFKTFKNGRTYLYGFSYGFMLIVISSLVSLIMNKLFNNSSVNNNESSIDSITSIYPILSLIIFGIVGPFCEELTYRVGLFGGLAKKNRVLAYVGTALIFGFLHFSFSTDVDVLKTEFINLPNYIVSGLLLSYYYEKEGLGVSFIAHMTNNLVSLFITILYSLI